MARDYKYWEAKHDKLMDELPSLDYAIVYNPALTPRKYLLESGMSYRYYMYRGTFRIKSFNWKMNYRDWKDTWRAFDVKRKRWKKLRRQERYYREMMYRTKDSVWEALEI